MTRRLKPRIKKRWVAALRSGQYRRAKEQIAAAGKTDVPAKFDPWGVLTCLYAKAAKIAPTSATYISLFMEAGTYRQLPTDEVLQWAAGCSAVDFDDYVQIGRMEGPIAGFNDSGCAWEKIAAAIEEQM